MPVGYIVKHNVPMIVTFDNFRVGLICDSLEDLIDMSYNMVSLFDIQEDFDPWGDEK